MHGNIRNRDKLCLWMCNLKAAGNAAETIELGREFQTETTRFNDITWTEIQEYNFFCTNLSSYTDVLGRIPNVLYRLDVAVEFQ